MAKQKENFLDFVPAKNPAFAWDVEKDTVTIHMEHTKLTDKLAQRFFHKPRVSHISLEKYGSFLWQQIDGEKSVLVLGEALKAKFGEEAEPLYPRLVQYMRTLRNNRFIYFAGKERLK